jgi:anti-sigma B factor antagonist
MSFYVKEAERVGQALLIRAGGELDMYAAPTLRDALTDARDAGAPRVLVDLAEVTFVDSTTIGVLVAASEQLREAGSGLCLRSTNRNVLRTFEITGLDRQIAISREPDPSEQVAVVPMREGVWIDGGR